MHERGSRHRNARPLARGAELFRSAGQLASGASRITLFVTLAALLQASACTSLRGRVAPVDPLRVSEVARAGDPARRASMRLVEAGLRADAAGRHARAQGEFERAIQVDPANPWAYLALARQSLDAAAPARAHAFLEQAHVLFETEGALSPRVEVYFDGLRGAIAYARGQRRAAAPDLARARARAPHIWGDGHLSADELL